MPFFQLIFCIYVHYRCWKVLQWIHFKQAKKKFNYSNGCCSSFLWAVMFTNCFIVHSINVLLGMNNQNNFIHLLCFTLARWWRSRWAGDWPADSWPGWARLGAQHSGWDDQTATAGAGSENWSWSRICSKWPPKRGGNTQERLGLLKNSFLSPFLLCCVQYWSRF